MISFILSPKRRQASITHLPIECKYCGDSLSEEGACEDPECYQADMPHHHVPHSDSVSKGEVVIDKRKLQSKPPTEHTHPKEADEEDQ